MDLSAYLFVIDCIYHPKLNCVVFSVFFNTNRDASIRELSLSKRLSHEVDLNNRLLPFLRLHSRTSRWSWWVQFSHFQYTSVFESPLQISLLLYSSTAMRSCICEIVLIKVSFSLPKRGRRVFSLVFSFPIAIASLRGWTTRCDERWGAGQDDSSPAHIVQVNGTKILYIQFDINKSLFVISLDETTKISIPTAAR